MYLSNLRIENFRCFGEDRNSFELDFHKGLTALVGENEAGKTAIIDAIRLVLGTTDQEWLPLEDSDFRNDEDEIKDIKIICVFSELSNFEKSSFLEYLSFGEERDSEPLLYYHWTAKYTGQLIKGRIFKRVTAQTGRNGDGPSLDPALKELLQATYLRPLRDAERSLSSGRGSRLAQILRNKPEIKSGIDECDNSIPLSLQELSVLGIDNLINNLLEDQTGIKSTKEDIDKNLTNLSIKGDNLNSSIRVGQAAFSEDRRLREMLEKLDLKLVKKGKPGLGSNNLLFMACELLLLSDDKVGNNLLLIEEPEAHLHAQRQLKIMKFLQNQSENKGLQILITTHSPNLASAIKLNNLVIVKNGKAYALTEELTKLTKSDYEFLERFLDVTKANLFFAKGLMIVEGDAENLLIPTLASLLNLDFTDNGVSIVNVGGVGLSRYARIFQRIDEDNPLDIPVACVTDSDVMPNCAIEILGLSKEGEDWHQIPNRKWRVLDDFGEDHLLKDYLKAKREKVTGQSVRSFLSNNWTFEYDLILGQVDENGVYKMGLAKDVFTAIQLAKNDEKITEGSKKIEDVQDEIESEFNLLVAEKKPSNTSTKEEVIATEIYLPLKNKTVSKAVVAQYLANILSRKYFDGEINVEWLKENLPEYLLSSIEYVTSTSN